MVAAVLARAPPWSISYLGAVVVVGNQNHRVHDTVRKNPSRRIVRTILSPRTLQK